MNMKTFIWGGMFIGTGIGGALPLLWGASAFSFTAVILTFVGGILGIWIGYRLAKYLGA
jgi:hypothetical protein